MLRKLIGNVKSVVVKIGTAALSNEAAAFLDSKDCLAVVEPTPQAIRAFNASKGRKIGLFHVTC